MTFLAPEDTAQSRFTGGNAETMTAPNQSKLACYAENPLNGGNCLPNPEHYKTPFVLTQHGVHPTRLAGEAMAHALTGKWFSRSAHWTCGRK